MSFSEKLLTKSNSYNFYRDGYELYKEKYEEYKKRYEDSHEKNLNKMEIIKSKNHILEKKQEFLDKKLEELEGKQQTITELKRELIEYQKANSKMESEIAEYEELTAALEEIYIQSKPDDKKDIKDLNIAYVLGGFPEHSETFIISELRWLKQNGFNVVVFHKREAYTPIELDFDIEYLMFNNLPHLERLLVDYDIDFMHTHFAFPISTKYTYPLSEKLKIPFTVFAHAFDIFKKESIENNNIAEISNCDLCLAIYTLSEFHKKYLVEHGVKEDKIVITKQATEYELSEFSKNDSKIRNVVAISRFVEKKGLDVLIDAAKLLEDEDLEFEIYGFGVLADDLERQIEELDCKNISIKGQLSPREVEDKLKESELLVAPCKVAENGDMDGIPTVLFESMAVGLPFISTSISAIPEIIEDGVNGFIVEPENPEMLAEKIRQVVDMSGDELYAIRCRAQEDVKQLAGVEKTMNTYIDVMKRI